MPSNLIKNAILKLINNNDGELGFSEIEIALGGHDISLLPAIKELLATGRIREEKVAACRFVYFISAKGRSEFELLGFNK